MSSSSPETPTRPREIYVSCRSGSARSHAAEQLAGALAQLRDGIVQPADGIAVAGTPGVVAVDGCSSACGARLLEAQGITPLAALTLDDIDVDLAPEAADAVLHAAETLVEHGAYARRARRPAPPTTAGSPRAHTLEDYLLAVDMLTSPVGPCGALVENAPTLAAHVSNVLGVSRPTAGEMLNRMEAEGLIQRGESRELVLSPQGRAAADDVIRGHRLLECFVVDTLGYDLANCFGHARQLSPSFGREDIGRLAEALGHPDRCPHGWPVDPAAARQWALELVSLSTLEAGEDATVDVVPEWDAPALLALAEVGITPGTRVTRTAAPDDGTLGFRVDGSERQISPRVADVTLVRRSLMTRLEGH